MTYELDTSVQQQVTALINKGQPNMTLKITRKHKLDKQIELKKNFGGNMLAFFNFVLQPMILE